MGRDDLGDTSQGLASAFIGLFVTDSRLFAADDSADVPGGLQKGLPLFSVNAVSF